MGPDQRLWLMPVPALVSLELRCSPDFQSNKLLLLSSRRLHGGQVGRSTDGQRPDEGAPVVGRAFDEAPRRHRRRLPRLSRRQARHPDRRRRSPVDHRRPTLPLLPVPGPASLARRRLDLDQLQRLLPRAQLQHQLRRLLHGRAHLPDDAHQSLQRRMSASRVRASPGDAGAGSRRRQTLGVDGETSEPLDLRNLDTLLPTFHVLNCA